MLDPNKGLPMLQEEKRFICLVVPQLSFHSYTSVFVGSHISKAFISTLTPNIIPKPTTTWLALDPPRVNEISRVAIVHYEASCPFCASAN